MIDSTEISVTLTILTYNCKHNGTVYYRELPSLLVFRWNKRQNVFLIISIWLTNYGTFRVSCIVKKNMHESLIKRITREDKIADGINREFAYLVDDVGEVSTGERFGATGFELGALLSLTTLGHDDAEPPKCTV